MQAPLASSNQRRDHLPVLTGVTSRRRFTRYALFTLLGAFTATSALATVKALYPTKITGFGTKIAVGAVAEVKAALATQGYVRSPVGRFYLLPTDRPDAAIAVYWKCKHLGCTVPPPSAEAGGKIECPCHNSWYDGRTGALLKGPATHPLDYMPISIVDGNVVVDTAKVTTRDRFMPGQATPLG